MEMTSIFPLRPTVFHPLLYVLFHLPSWRMRHSPRGAILPSVGRNYMTTAVHQDWDTLSNQFAEVAEQTGKSVVAVHGGRRVAGSGIIWRPGIIVTASHMLRQTDGVEVTLADKSRHKVSVAGRDPGTDVAVLRLEIGRASCKERVEVGGVGGVVKRS